MKSALLFPLCAIAAAAQSQPPPPDSLLQSLLSEVHQLRVAIERSNSIGPRIQLAVERLKLQQSIVTRVSDQLDNVRHEMESHESDAARLGSAVKSMEAELLKASDPSARAAMERNIDEIKTHLEQTQKLAEGLRAREADLSSRLRTEQATLDGLNDSLNQIERSLSQ